MDWRTLAATAAFAIVVGLPAAVAELVHIPMEARQGLSPAVYVLQLELVSLFALSAVVLVAYLYLVRWRAYRPAIHLATVLVLFVAGLAWWLGPPGVGSAEEPLSTTQTQVIRMAGVLLLVYLVVFLSDQFNGSDFSD